MHPIFDAREYPYSITEAKALYLALCNAYPTVPAAVGVFQNCGGSQTDLLIAQAVSDLWMNILREIAAKGKLQTLRAELNNNPIPNYLKAALEAAEAVPLIPDQTPGQEYEQLVLTSKTVVLDRKKVVNKLGELLDSKNFISVLMVTGDEKSGKSHTKHIFDYYRDNQKTISVNITSKTVFTIGEMLKRLFGRVSAEAPTIPDTTDAAWYQAVCEKLRQEAEKKNIVFWIVIDDIRKLDKLIKDFFDQFVALMEDFSYRQFFRLVLIDYPGEKQTCWTLDHLEEVELKASDIEPSHIKEAISFWCKKYNKNMFETPMTEKANEIFKLACPENAPCCKLDVIHSQLLKYFEELSNEIR